MTTTEDPAPSAHHESLHAEQVGYKQNLNRRHVQMIAIGGAIGTGLFLGSASRLHSTGPALLLSYAFVGVIAYFLMRARSVSWCCTAPRRGLSSPTCGSSSGRKPPSSPDGCTG
jgi:amino acid permease